MSKNKIEEKTAQQKEPNKTAHGFAIPENFRNKLVQFPYSNVKTVDFRKSPSKTVMERLHKHRPGQFKKT